MLRISLYIIILSTLLLLSCIKQPTKPIGKEIPGSFSEGVLVLCEGLYGQSNSSLSIYDYTDVYHDVFRTKNDLNIGDTANDILINGDTTFIVVSSNKKIVVINTKTQKLITEIFLPLSSMPRKIVKMNISTLAISSLTDNSIYFLDINKLELLADKLQTGPAPEGVAVYDNLLFVANSGYGDYLSDQKDAGTIYVYDLASKTMIKKLEYIPNVIELLVSENKGKLYARYNHLPKYTDSIGGIVEFDIQMLIATKSWKTKCYQMELTKSNDSLFFISDYGIQFINLEDDISSIHDFIEKTNKDDIWYDVRVHPSNEELWITNAKNYQSNGEVIVYSLYHKDFPKFTLKVGLNPNTIAFF